MTKLYLLNLMSLKDVSLSVSLKNILQYSYYFKWDWLSHCFLVLIGHQCSICLTTDKYVGYLIGLSSFNNPGYKNFGDHRFLCKLILLNLRRKCMVLQMNFYAFLVGYICNTFNLSQRPLFSYPGLWWTTLVLQFSFSFI